VFVFVYCGYRIGYAISPNDGAFLDAFLGCLVIVSACVALGIFIMICIVAIPAWIKLNRKWADKIYKRYKTN
jgi:hypothetical protein